MYIYIYIYIYIHMPGSQGSQAASPCSRDPRAAVDILAAPHEGTGGHRDF